MRCEEAVGVIVSGGEIVCTAFVAPLYSRATPTLTWILTAAHPVHEYCIRGIPLLFRPGDGEEYVLSSRLIPSPGRDDFAVFSIPEIVDLAPLHCASAAPLGRVRIRGAPSGLWTEFTNVVGELLGVEDVRGTGIKVLEVLVHELGYPAFPPQGEGHGLTAHQVWRGLSGAPIMSAGAGGERVVGVVRRMMRHGVAGRLYGTPIRVVEEACRDAGLVLETTLNDPLEVHTPTDLVATSMRGVEQPEVEQQAWRRLSQAMFREGRCVIDGVDEVLSAPRQFGLNSIEEGFLGYFRARMAGKAAQRLRSIVGYRQAVIASARLPKEPRSRLAAVAHARLLLQSCASAAMGPAFGRLISSIRHPLEAVGHDDYVAAELSSLLGALCEDLYHRIDVIHPSARDELSALVHEHKDLSIRPSLIEQQEVVICSFDILERLTNAGLNPATAAEDAILLARSAFGRSRRRHNAIFCLQMLLCRSIASHILGRNDETVASAMVAATGLRTMGVRPTHEGVRVLHGLLARHSAPLAECFHAAYSLRIDMPAILRFERLQTVGLIAGARAHTTLIAAAAGLVPVRREEVPWAYWRLIDDALRA